MAMNRNTRIGYLFTIYTVFILTSFFVCSKFFSFQDGQSVARLAESEYYTRLSAIFFFAWTILFGLLYFSSYMALHFGSNPSRSLFIPFLAKKYPSGRSTVLGAVFLGKKKIPFAKVLIFDEAENEIGYFFANSSGDFKIKIKNGKYIFQGEGFGFEGRATKAVKASNNEKIWLELDCFSKEDIVYNPRSYHLLLIEKYAFFLSSLFAPILGWFVSYYQFSALGIIVTVLGICAFSIFIFADRGKLVIRERKGTKIRGQELEISDSTGKKKHKVETDLLGNLFILLSTGIYKISHKGSLPRNVRVRTRSIANADIKLG